MWGEAADLVWPHRCAGCGAPGRVLCQACREALLGPVTRREEGAPRLVPADGGPRLPVWSSAWYAGAVRRAIVQWKRHGRAELDVEMTRAVGRVAEHIARDLALVLRVLGEDGLVVAPIPSRASTRAARGTLGTELLAGAVAGALAGAGIAARPLACLARRASATDQAGLSLRARAANREGATRLRVVPDAPVVLVDDVLTTGATLLDAERALARAGARTLGAVALAATPSGSWNR